MIETIEKTNFRNFTFDQFFINFIPLLAISSALIVAIFPQYFEIVLTLDLFFLGYHHVISTYTRLSNSGLTNKEFKFLIYVLPFIVLGGVILCIKTGYTWIVPTIYLHWQWWHYTRQSEGISKSIRFKTKSLEIGGEVFNRAVFYMVPVLGLLVASSRQHATFLFMPVKTIPFPVNMIESILIIGFIVWFIWFLKMLKAFYFGKVSWQSFSYQLNHHIIYLVSYILIEDITVGWLAINIWHNFQYIVFVWHVNLNKFSSGYDSKNPILSWCCQANIQRSFIYFSLCLIVTYFIYSSVDYGINVMSDYTILPLTIIFYQSINFHHYVVDTLIWKLRKPVIRESVGIKA